MCAAQGGHFAKDHFHNGAPISAMVGLGRSGESKKNLQCSNGESSQHMSECSLSNKSLLLLMDIRMPCILGVRSLNISFRIHQWQCVSIDYAPPWPRVLCQTLFKNLLCADVIAEVSTPSLQSFPVDCSVPNLCTSYLRKIMSLKGCIVQL